MKSTVRTRYSFIKILTGSDLSIRRLPLMTAISSNPGPAVWLTACIHGDEIVGMAIIQEIFRKIRRRLTRGAVHAFPLMNPIGFETTSRKITLSHEDLNRSFPGNPDGTLGERIASRIFNTIIDTRPDLVLDLHSDWKQSIPYTLIDKKPVNVKKETYDKTIQFAKQAGFVCILEDDMLSDSLSHNLLKNDIPALTLELGEPFVINEENVEFGLDAIWNILAHLEMTDPMQEDFRHPSSQSWSGKLFKYSDKPYSSKSGIIRFLARPGDRINKGEPFAKIVNVFGKHQETVNAVNDGMVLGHSDSSVVFPGMPIMAFGII